MYAIFENGSKQYKVSVGDLVKVEKLNAEIGATVQFPVILTADEKGIQVGKEVDKVKVSCEVVAQGKERRLSSLSTKPRKTRERSKVTDSPSLRLK